MTVPAIPDQTRLAQQKASNPLASAWVSANAGSGKTHVLAQRVIRILLEGTPPAKILCLTFTKTAAANMASRVYDTLAKWTLLPDVELVAEIVNTGAPSPTPQELILARRLFARTIETPGGLKIQTIHAFCERLLHLFPFEANMAAGFTVMDQERQALLLGQSRIATLAQAIDPTSPLNSALQLLAGSTNAADFDKLLNGALKHRADIAERAMEPGGGALAQALGMTGNESVPQLEAEILEDGLLPSRAAEIATILQNGLVADSDRAIRLLHAAQALELGATALALEVYYSVFFTKAGERAARLVTKNLAARHPDILEDLSQEAERVDDLRERLRIRISVDMTTALLTLANAIFQHYEGQKRARSLIDFEDLIERTRNLLKRSDAQWVLYKLDAGIEHILVDEAQDTSPAQWDILKTIAVEFTSGAGQSYRVRTLFAVGDEKQSIYSFQGAAPHMFAQMRRHFAPLVRDAEQIFADVQLNLSFRSSPVILKAVDLVFGHADNKRGMTADGEGVPPHEAWRRDLPGFVEIWQEFRKIDTDVSKSWALPLELTHSPDPATRLAEQVAAQIADLVKLGSPDRVHERSGAARAVQPGDILVLVRARNGVFDHIIRALKDKNVPVAGADRLVLTDHIGVQDLMALGAVMLLPDDDLSLAVVLKSPLIGLDDDDLIELAPSRLTSLWAALRDSANTNFREIAGKLENWRQKAQQNSPFMFYAGLLGRDGGRRAIEARLGFEAGDAIDEFMRLALGHDREDAPSLANFLGALQAADLEIKRDMEAAGNTVRVMTVHGAKGLEAKIVFLPDTCSNPAMRRGPDLVDVREHGMALAGDNHRDAAILAWTKGEKSKVVAAALDHAKKLALEESRRLLYVAMTRAEERLYIAGFTNQKSLPAASWYAMIHAALTPQATRSSASWDTQASIWHLGARAISLNNQMVEKLPPAPALPAWLLAPAVPEASPLPPISPSRVLASADQLEAPGSGAASAMFIGRLTHTLMQYLPDVAPAARASAGRQWLAAQGGDVDRETLLAQVTAMLDNPKYNVLFGPDSRAEVSIAGEIIGHGGTKIAIAGQIDRVAVVDNTVWIVDYKTGFPKETAKIPAQYVTQLALYRAVMQKIYAGHEIRALILWTAGPELAEIEPAKLLRALESMKLA